MKKKILLLIIILFSFINVNASTNTFERTEDDLRVPDYITVTQSNLYNIMTTPSVDESEKIYDFANLFSEADEDHLLSEVKDFITTSNLDLVIVTISENEKGTAQVYADDFYDYNKFGIGSNHNGLLFLIDMDTREIYMSTTGSAIDIYTDDRIDNILDNIFRYFSNKEYYEGTSKFIKLALAYTDIDQSEDGNYVINRDGKLVKSNKELLGSLVFAGIATLIIILVMVMMNKMVFKASSSSSYLKKDTMKVERTNELFLGSHVSKVRINNNSGSSGGGSIHIGSSGFGHGGGGHKF